MSSNRDRIKPSGQSASTPSEPLHVRARWRLFADDHRALPSKTVTGFTFVDPEGTFLGVDRKAHYIHRYRLKTPAIHAYARKRFIADIVQPLNLDWYPHRQKVDDKGVEVFELSHGNACVLLTLRNWVNPVFAQEITRVSKALNSRELELRKKYGRIWKCIIAPSFENWQTTLDQFADIRFYNLDYIIPESLPDRLARETGVDYRAAYPHKNTWSRELVEELQGILRGLLELDSTGSSLLVENRARTGHQAPSPSNDSTNKPESLLVKGEGSHIVTIADRRVP